MDKRTNGGEDWFVSFSDDDSVQHTNDTAPERDPSPNTAV